MATIPVKAEHQKPLTVAVEAARETPSRNPLYDQWLDHCPLCRNALVVVIDDRRYLLEASGFEASVEDMPMTELLVECETCDFRCSLADVFLDQE